MANIRYLEPGDLDFRHYVQRRVTEEVLLQHLASHPERPLTYTVTHWHKTVGDRVQVCDIIATIENEEMILEVEVYYAGVISECCFPIGVPIPDRAVLARITLDKLKTY